MNPVVFVALAAFAAGLGLVLGRRRAERTAARETPIDLTLLLRSSRVLTVEHLVFAVREAFGRDLAGTSPDAPEFVAAEGRVGAVQIDGYAFALMSVPEPFLPDPEAASEGIPELRMRKAFAEHRACVVFGCPRRPPGASRADAYARLGRLVAALADDTTLLVYCPELRRGALLNETTLDGLRGGDPLRTLQTLGFDAIGMVDGDDPRLMAATAEARRRLPEFVAAFRSAQEPADFLVKGPFTDGENTEFMWLVVTAVEGETIHGTLANEPFGVRGLRQGSTVSLPFTEVSDWGYPGEAGPVGLFTEKIVRSVL